MVAANGFRQRPVGLPRTQLCAWGLLSTLAHLQRADDADRACAQRWRNWKPTHPAPRRAGSGSTTPSSTSTRPKPTSPSDTTNSPALAPKLRSRMPRPNSSVPCPQPSTTTDTPSELKQGPHGSGQPLVGVARGDLTPGLPQNGA
ncbi:hypothetical protein EES39_31105 [Streptomyces sp. ADI92-24]|nr:hypothetical protein EES39_31105 [Streptomyces sp. ADI92-24]